MLFCIFNFFTKFSSLSISVRFLGGATIKSNIPLSKISSNALTAKGAKEEIDADEVVKCLLQDYNNAETNEERMKIAKLMNEFSELKGLIKVATSGHIDVAKQMIATGVNVNSEVHGNSTTLIEAVKRGNRKVVEMLISSGANINQKDEDGNSVLSFADSNMRRTIFKAAKSRYQRETDKTLQRGQEVER